jgi:pimeloyl-ACP methyl ester carboxylesterase
VLPALREYGAPDGRPLLFIHGWPGCGSQALLFDAAAKAHGFRVIAPDRPGIGGSPHLPGRRLLDWPPLVREIATHFGLLQLAVLGMSGGGPYALASAWALPGLVRAASIVCGAPPIADLPHLRGLHPGYRFLLRLFRLHPGIVRGLFRTARPVIRWRPSAKLLQPLRVLLPQPDSAALADRASFDIVFGSQRDAFTNVDGLFDDASLYIQPWGFALEKIRIPVHFWHGRADSNFHFSLAEQLAARVPGAVLRLVENEGHYSLPIRQADAILAALAAAC